MKVNQIKICNLIDHSILKKSVINWARLNEIEWC